MIYSFPLHQTSIPMTYSADQISFLTLNIGYARQHADWNWKDVRSPFARIYLVTEGTAQIVIDGETVTLTPGHLYLVPAYTRHSYVCAGLFCHYYLHIYENNANDSSVMADWTFPTEVEASPIDGQLMKRLCEINPFLELPSSNPDSYDNHQSIIHNIQLTRKSPLCDKIETQGIVYMLFSRFMKNARPKRNIKDNRIQEAMTHILHHLDTPIELSVLADKACMSKDHLIRVFKQETGCTPNVFITRRKMEKAELLLVTTEHPVKNIAAALGYDDYSYFNRLFKKATGLTPQQYRVKHY